MSGDSGNLSIDFLVGFTIFLIAFIWVVSMIPGLMIGLQSYTIDSDAVAYRTGVILAEDPGEPAFPLFPWETRLCDVPPDYCKKNVVRFGLAVSKNIPDILSRSKVDTFFCSSVFSYPDDYQQRVIFGDYPYRFNISLMEVGSTQPPKSVGDSMSGNFGSIRRLVKIKESSYATINASSINASYVTTTQYFSGDNETVHEFSILIDNTELLRDKVRDPVYQIDPARERITINITHLNETMAGPYANRNSCFNINLTHIYAKDPALVRIQLFTAPVLDGVQYKDINTEAIYATLPSVKNNISLKLDPGFIPWSNYPRVYLTLRFNLVQNASAPAALNCSAYNGSRFLNNSLSSAFDYNYDPKNVTQSELTDGVLEVSTGSGYRTVTGPAPVNLSANFKYEILTGTPNFNVKFTDLSTGSPVEWAWNFTNGGVTIDSPLNNPTFNYGPAGGAGIYTVKLTVKDASGNSAFNTTNVDLSAPVNVGFTGSPLSGPEPLVVQFAGTYSGGAPSSWKWEYNKTSGGGWQTFNTTSQNPVNTFTDGYYDIRLTATNIFGSNTSTGYSYINATASHTITATAGANGAISPSGAVLVAFGANQAFTITPNTDCHITNVVVDGVSQGAVSTYTFYSVIAAHTISASFAIDAPTFISITPNSGAISGGTAVTITGTNLIGATAVNFSASVATGVSVVSSTSITATTPAHAAGAVNVSITTPNGTAIGTGAYTYSTYPLTAIGAITGTPQVGSLLTAGALTPAGATATYQWQRATTSGGVYSNIVGATATTYTPVAVDGGYYIKVVATGTGSYTGTVTSAYVGPVTIVPTIQTITSSGTYAVPQGAISVDYCVVGGGGGGGYYGGGGGAGGFRTGTITGGLPSSYTVTVGNGGNRATSAAQGSSGGISVFASITSDGGGGGGSSSGTLAIRTGANGGSGGGGVRSGTNGGTGNTPAVAPSQGNNGGAGNTNGGNYLSGGGGGAGGSGVAATTTVGGNGGAGSSCSINSVTYAGGGGGGVQSTYTAGTATNGGGAGGKGAAGTSGTVNTGGGGGGGGSGPSNGGNGGSGIVILKYY